MMVIFEQSKICYNCVQPDVKIEWEIVFLKRNFETRKNKTAVVTMQKQYGGPEKTEH
jgi:hypothetical protein